MPLAQGSAFWGLQRVFTHSRSTKEHQSTENKAVSSTCFPSSRKFSHAPHLFSRRTSPPPSRSPRRSTSAPHELPLKSTSDPQTPNACQPIPERQSCSPLDTSSKSFPSFHTSPESSPQCTSTDSLHSSCPNPQTSEYRHSNNVNNSSTHMSLPNSQICSAPTTLESPAPIASTTKPNLPPFTKPQMSSPQRSYAHSKTLPLGSLSPQSSPTKLSPSNPSTCKFSPSYPTISFSPPKSPATQTSPRRATPCSSPHRSSHNNSPLKSPSSPRSSPRRASPQGKQLPMAPGPPWSELMEARRRLLAVEGRRRALCALEMRVQQIHCVFLHAELRVAKQGEGLARLVEAAGRAEVQAAVHGQRIRRALRHHKPRLLACALCVPFAGKAERRGGQHARRTRCSLLQGRVQALGGCVGGGGDDLGARE
ncbi:TMF-regulated nuclear protein 1 [Discoglossus pictus]